MCMHARDSSDKDPDVGAWIIIPQRKNKEKRTHVREEEDWLGGHGESLRKCARKGAFTAAVKTAAPSSMKNVFSKEII